MRRITAEDGTLTAELTSNEWTKLIDARKICNEIVYIEDGGGEDGSDRGKRAAAAFPQLASIIATRPT